MHYAVVVEGDGSNQGRYEGAFGEHIGVVYGFVLSGAKERALGEDVSVVEEQAVLFLFCSLQAESVLPNVLGFLFPPQACCCAREILKYGDY